MTGNKGAIDRLLPVVDEFYSRDGNECGGILHIVLDDSNVERSHVQSCIYEALWRGDYAAVYLGGKLLKLSKTQRGKLTQRFHHDRRPPSMANGGAPVYLPEGPLRRGPWVPWPGRRRK